MVEPEVERFLCILRTRRWIFNHSDPFIDVTSFEKFIIIIILNIISIIIFIFIFFSRNSTRTNKGSTPIRIKLTRIILPFIVTLKWIWVVRRIFYIFGVIFVVVFFWGLFRFRFWRLVFLVVIVDGWVLWFFASYKR